MEKLTHEEKELLKDTIEKEKNRICWELDFLKFYIKSVRPKSELYKKQKAEIDDLELKLKSLKSIYKKFKLCED